METSESLVNFNRKPDNYQPNPITESRQEFSELEKKIVVNVINQLGQVAKSWKGQNLHFIIPFTELTESNHGKIRKAAISITSKKITLVDKTITELDETYYHFIIPFTEVMLRKIKGKHYLQIAMNGSIVPHFIELGKQFTKYSLDIMLSLSSVYTQRFYEIIMLHVGRKQKNFSYSIDTLKFIFNCPESYTYNEIRKRALKPAQKELHTKAGIVFNFEPSKKEGKKVLELNFTIKSEIEIALDAMMNEASTFHQSTPSEQKDFILRMLNNYSFTKQQQHEIMGDPKKWAVFMQIDSEIYNGLRKNIENPTAYIAKSLGFDKSPVKKKNPKQEKLFN